MLNTYVIPSEYRRAFPLEKAPLDYTGTIQDTIPDYQELF